MSKGCASNQFEVLDGFSACLFQGFLAHLAAENSLTLICFTPIPLRFLVWQRISHRQVVAVLPSCLCFGFVFCLVVVLMLCLSVVWGDLLCCYG